MDEGQEAAAAQPIRVAVAVVLGLLWSVLSNRFFQGFYSPFPYGQALAAALSDVVVMLLLTAAATGRSPSQLIDHIGLFRSPVRPLIWALALLLPCYAICRAMGLPLVPLGSADILWPGLGAPIAEDLIARGLAIGLLVHLGRWHWLPAALAPPLVMTAAYGWFEGGFGADLALILLAGSVAAVLLGWLYQRWQWNLWPVLFLHAGFNLLWLAFSLGDTIVGNQLRVGLALAAIGLSLWMVPRTSRTA